MTAPDATPIVPSERIGKFFKWAVIIAVVAFLYNGFRNFAVEKEKNAEADRAAAKEQQAAEAVPITLGYGAKGYPKLPSVQKVTLVVPLLDEALRERCAKDADKNNKEKDQPECWTAEFRRPDKARTLCYDSASDIEMEMSFGEGEVKKFHDSPRITRFESRPANTVKWMNLGEKPVVVTLTMTY